MVTLSFMCGHLPLVLLLSVAVLKSEGGTDKIRLRNVDTLTFHRDSYTSTRRGQSIPELRCIGGSAMKFPEYRPHSVQCYNRGFDGHDVQWECKAELNKAVRFGRTSVNCEGYYYPEDEFVLAGSCGLEYELEFVDTRKTERSTHYFRIPTFSYRPSFTFSPFLPVFGLLVFAVLIWYCCLRDTTDEMQRSQHSSAFGDGVPPVPPSAPYSWDIPPPSYEESTRRYGSAPDDYGTRQRGGPSTSDYGWNIPSSGRTFGSHFDRPKPSTQSTSWLSNGLAAGAGFLGGYLFGSTDRHRSRTTTTTYQNPLYPEFPESHSFTPSHTSPVREDEGRRSPQHDSYVATSFAKTKRR